MKKSLISISSVEDFEKLRELKNGEGCIVNLERNIDFDCSRCYKNPSDHCMGYVPGYMVKPFELENSNIIINGNGYTISNIKIYDVDETKINTALFRRVGNLVVKNITFDNACVCGPNNSALLVGSSQDTVAIHNSKFDGQVNGKKFTAGLVSACENLVINNSVSSLDVTGEDFSAAIVSTTDRYTQNDTIVEKDVNITKSEAESMCNYFGFARTININHSDRLTRKKRN